MKYINGPMGFFAPCDTYVRWSDYAALAAENERLRKAGDELLESFKQTESLMRTIHATNAWNAAKEGGAK